MQTQLSFAHEIQITFIVLLTKTKATTQQKTLCTKALKLKC